MGEVTKIEWCHHTFNPWRGCTKVSAGCAHCYAETLSHRNPAVLGEWGSNGTRVVAAESAWREPRKWDRAAKAAGERRRVFCASLADVFEANDQVYETRGRLWDLIDETPNLDWLLLTKRPENLPAFVPWCFDHAGEYRENFWPNVWLGVSVEDQAAADERIPALLEILAAVRFLSVEPLLGPVDLTRLTWRGDRIDALDSEHDPAGPRIDWVIVGGESGPNARPCDVAWIRSIVDQCAAAGVSCFVKQLGAKPGEWSGPGFIPGSLTAMAIDAHLAAGGSEPDDDWYPLTLADRKGGEPAEWPADLRVQEWPR
jgi:protein gp37